MKTRDSDGLTSQEAAFAAGLAGGLDRAAAYRQANPDSQANANSTYQMASTKAADPRIQSRAQELLNDAKIAELDTVGEAWTDLLRVMETAETTKNLTAFANLMRQRLQGLGVGDKLIIQDGYTDEQIIDKLSNGNEHKAKMLKAIIGEDTFDD